MEKTRVLSKIILLSCIFLALLLSLGCVSALSDKEKQQISQYDSILKQAAMEQEIPLALLKTIMYIESRGKTDSVSCTGAVGPFQFTYDTARGGYFSKDVTSKIASCSCTACSKGSYGCKEHNCPSTDPRFDIALSTAAAAKMLKALLNNYDNNLFLVGVAYNRGPAIANYIENKVGNKARKEEITGLVRESVHDYCSNPAHVSSKGNCLGEQWPSKEKEIAQQGINYVNDLEKYFVEFGGFSAASSDSAYYVNPSFRQYVPYNMSMFDKIKEQAEVLIACKNEPKKQGCIDKQLSEFNKDTSVEWSQDCELGYEKIFYDFMYNIERCSRSMYDLNTPGCMCNFNMDYKDKSINKTYTIKMSKRGNGILFELMNPKDKNLVDSIASQSLLSIQDQGFKFTDMKKGPAMKDYPELIFSINYNHQGLLGIFRDSEMCYGFNSCNKDKASCDICSDTRKLSSSYNVHVYKSGNKLAFISTDKYFSSLTTIGYDKVKECEPPPKVEYAFCAKDTTSELFNYDKATETGEYSNPVVKFALSFKDDTAPPTVEKISASDALKAENKMVISFDTPKEKNTQTSDMEYIPDLFYYDIYCRWYDLNSKLPEINGGTTALQPVAQQLAEQKPTNEVTIDKCYNKNDLLEDIHDMPYAAEPSLSYHITVQPVDLSDNKAPVKIAVQATPIDDLSPDGSMKGEADLSQVKKEEGFSYLIPIKNEINNKGEVSNIREDEVLKPVAYAQEIKLGEICGNALSIVKKGKLAEAAPRKISELLKNKDGSYDRKTPASNWRPFFNYASLGIQKGKPDVKYCVVAFVRDAAGNPQESDPNFNKLVSKEVGIIP